MVDVRDEVLVRRLLEEAVSEIQEGFYALGQLSAAVRPHTHAYGAVGLSSLISKLESITAKLKDPVGRLLGEGIYKSLSAAKKSGESRRGRKKAI